MFSKLTNSSCSRFSAFFTSIFITLHHYTAFSLSIREKGHQKVTFFDRLQRVEKVFSPRCADFETFKKVSKSCLIERAVGFLPPAHTPRCSIAQVFNEVF